MKAVFSMLGLVIVVAIVGLLAKKQLTASAPAGAATSAVSGAPVVSGTPQQQVDQMRQAAEAAVQSPRAMPDESK